MKYVRAKVLGLFSLVLLIGVVAAGPAAAATPEAEAVIPEAEAVIPEAEAVIPEAEEGPVEPVTISPMSLAQCTQGTMCIWQANEWEGNFSYWYPQNDGCHAHAANPEIRSVWNRFGFDVELEGYGRIHSGERWYGKGVFKGLVCWGY